MDTPPGLFVIREDGSLVGLKEALYDSEALLQGFLARHPDLLAGPQINPGSPRRWILVTRELGIPAEEGGPGRWSLDHLFIDQDGIPTLVEVKRSTDTRIRREVVGQMLDYAANGVLHWPIDTIRLQFEERCDGDGKSPESELKAFLGSDADPDAFWLQVKTNLQAGRVRLLFVADEIPVELRRVIEFLNEQMDPAEVLGVEVRNYVGEGIRTLVPRVFGLTAQKSDGPGRRSQAWNKDSFFTKLAERQNAIETAVAQRLFEWAVANCTRVDYGKGATVASFVPVQMLQESWFGPFRVYTGYRAAYVEIPLGGTGMRTPPFNDPDRRHELVRRLNMIPGVQIADDVSRFPSIDLAVLGEADRTDRFLDVARWALDLVNKAADASQRNDAQTAALE